MHVWGHAIISEKTMMCSCCLISESVVINKNISLLGISTLNTCLFVEIYGTACAISLRKLLTLLWCINWSALMPEAVIFKKYARMEHTDSCHEKTNHDCHQPPKGNIKIVVIFTKLH
mmetsp:Transcript_68632/g.101997  ORF Transcript_68632/g.101997 Transcript_68632/m.101997 type:complete len:117 (-) Transcript_68632:14-364(-)